MINTNKDRNVIKEEILHYLCDDFPGNQAIFNKKEGYQVFNGTDLTMVMDKVSAGLKSAQRRLAANENTDKKTDL